MGIAFLRLFDSSYHDIANSAEQVDEFFTEIDKVNEEMYEEFLGRTAEEREKARAKYPWANAKKSTRCARNKSRVELSPHPQKQHRARVELSPHPPEQHRARVELSPNPQKQRHARVRLSPSPQKLRRLRVFVSIEPSPS